MIISEVSSLFATYYLCRYHGVLSSGTVFMGMGTVWLGLFWNGALPRCPATATAFSRAASPMHPSQFTHGLHPAPPRRVGRQAPSTSPCAHPLNRARMIRGPLGVLVRRQRRGRPCISDLGSSARATNTKFGEQLVDLPHTSFRIHSLYPLFNIVVSRGLSPPYHMAGCRSWEKM